MMWLTQSTTVPGPSHLAFFSATTMLDTIGHDSLMNPLRTSRHDAILCGKVPPAKHRPQLLTQNKNSVFQGSLVSTVEHMNETDKITDCTLVALTYWSESRMLSCQIKQCGQN
jgi:hypothetical protein